jgi:hypothetical protein
MREISTISNSTKTLNKFSPNFHTPSLTSLWLGAEKNVSQTEQPSTIENAILPFLEPFFQVEILFLIIFLSPSQVLVESWLECSPATSQLDSGIDLR